MEKVLIEFSKAEISPRDEDFRWDYNAHFSVSFAKIYRSGTVNSKSFVGKVLLRIKWKFELTYAL